MGSINWLVARGKPSQTFSKAIAGPLRRESAMGSKEYKVFETEIYKTQSDNNWMPS